MRRNKTIGTTGRLSLLKAESGSSVVEYAIVFIILMTMLLGIADFSRALYAYHFVSNVARDAARYASVRGFTCSDDVSCTAANSASGVAGPSSAIDIQDFVKKVPVGIDPAKLTTNPSWSNPSGLTACTTHNNNPGCTVKVQVSYNFPFFSPLVSKSTLTFSSTSQETITH
jgi:Flp pilus assembly protein TadG